MRLAIIIPTLNESTTLTDAIDHAQACGDVVVVSDGGSSDGSLDQARRSSCIVVEAPRGRGSQIAAGIEAARGSGASAVLILHADTRLPIGARDAVKGALDDGAVGGGFEVRFGSPLYRFRWGERFVNLRSRALRVPLGDQAQFARLDSIEEIGGFPALPILEDLKFIRGLRKVGPLAILKGPAVTSTRRLERGTMRTVLVNWSIWGLYLLGFSPERLARMYRDVR